MGFGDLKTEGGLKSLNDYLADKSYIEGYQPSQADAKTFEALAGSPSAKYPHVLRWYRHISSYNDHKNFPECKSIPSFEVETKQQSVTSKAPSKTGGGDDDDFDLFGSDDEQDAEAEKLKQERLKQYEQKKSKKPGVIAKSNVILDVKPWDDETDMKLMEESVRTIGCDGLVWGVSKLVPLAYGIQKLQIVCVVEDDKVSIDWLQEEIEKFEELVQSVDIAAFQKI